VVLPSFRYNNQRSHSLIPSCHNPSIKDIHSCCPIDARISLAFDRSFLLPQIPSFLNLVVMPRCKQRPPPRPLFTGKPMRLKEGTHPSALLPFAMLLSGGSCLSLFPSLSFLTDLLTEIISSNSFAFQTTMTSSTHPPPLPSISFTPTLKHASLCRRF
jgi:hypothetical protein